MTKRYFIWFNYDGTRYHGWQIQPNGITVQGELQRCLTTVLRHPIEVTGAGRTDTGVHARQMVAHFDWELPPIDCQQLAYRLNRMLPPDISVQKVEEVAPDMHARFSATSRTYHYYFTTQRDPFCRQYACQLHYSLDRQLMDEACRVMLEYNDFAAFCKSHSDARTTLCNLTECQIIDQDDTHFYLRITANRFLRNMVRAVVGTLMEVGRGRMSISQLRNVIENGSRSDAGESMPAHALFLENVRYSNPY